MTFLAQNIYLPGQPLCVVKKHDPQFTDPTLIAIAQKQFELEALSLSRLGSHAQIPSLLDYFQVGTDLYLVAEYIPGSDLLQIVTKQRRFNDAAVEIFLTQMLQLLDYLQLHHLIHCDIKPQNIRLRPTDCRFVLVDFGIVKDIAATTSRHDLDSMAVGTPGFAPPEQLANRTKFASDLYARNYGHISIENTHLH